MPDKKSVKEWLEEIAYGNAKLWSAFYSDADSKELANSALAMLKEQGAELLQQEAELDILRNIYRQENPNKQMVKWE